MKKLKLKASSAILVLMSPNGQGFAQLGNSTPLLPEPSAECRKKKLIIYSFAHRNRSAQTADDSSTTADVFSVCPTCAKPHPMFTFSYFETIL
jgi:hypothetical protein